MWNLFVSGIDEWDLVPFVDGQPADYHIKRDDELIGLMREECDRFRVDHILKGVPPDPDGSKSYGHYLSTAYPQRKKDLVSLDDKPEAMMLVRALRRELDVLAEAKTSTEIIKQNLKAVIGDHSGLEWADPERKGGKDQIYYRIAKDGKKTDWEAAWRSLVTEAQLVLSVDSERKAGITAIDVAAYYDVLTKIADENRSIALHTDTVPGSRRFNVPRSWSKNPNKED
jgi:hypothetical protein